LLPAGGNREKEGGWHGSGTDHKEERFGGGRAKGLKK